ncbi:MAG: biotin/lipoyl-containing protein [Pseudomonadota bacterium]
MPHEVKMPQLGMTQDSGVIVSWLKAAGDAVAAGDALFEVETDKATMEVEAPVAGFLSGVCAGEGDDVPVGQVIALIVASAAEVDVETAPDPVPAPAPATAPASPDPEPTPGQPPDPDPAPTPAPRIAPLVSGGRVLASPKARRLALEQGIDLAALRASGVPEPIHAGDLAQAAPGRQSTLTAEVEGIAFTALLAHASETADRTRILAGFARRAWESRLDSDSVAVLIRGLDGAQEIDGRDGDPVALALIDLCDTRLSGYAPPMGTTLTVARGTSGHVLTLSFAESALPFQAAAALLDDIAARIDDPIRQLI